MEHKPTDESSVSTRIIRPYVGENWWIPVYNDIIDTVLPHLSFGALKVLLLVVDQTWPSQPGVAPYQRRQWLRFTYTQLQARTGIGSRTTVSRALSELMAKGYLLRRQVDTESGRLSYAYRLNWELDAEVVDPDTSPPASESKPAQRSGTTL
jgi:hypothetical protein